MNWELTFQAISALSGLLIIIYIIFLKKQISYNHKQIDLLKKQIDYGHERSRRENALKLMQFWISNQNQFKINERMVIDLINSFDSKQCKRLWNQEEIEIDNKVSIKELIENLMKADKRFNPVINQKTIKLKKNEVCLLRHTAVLFFNLLEMIATAWRHNIADRSLIEEEFFSMILESDGKSVLEMLRNNTGIYPSLSSLTKKLKEKSTQSEKPSLTV